MSYVTSPPETSLIGIGIFSPTEAGTLLGTSPAKLVRWLGGHSIGDRAYAPLWPGQIDVDDGRVYLGFRDLIQARMALKLIHAGVSAQKVRAAIVAAASILDVDHPFANARFRTDGTTILLQTLTPGEDNRLIDLLSEGQYVMRRIIEPSLRDVEFDADFAARWWPLGKAGGIVVDPARSFGQPIDDRTGVPTTVLRAAVKTEGSIAAAARAFAVTSSSVERAIAFESRLAA